MTVLEQTERNCSELMRAATSVSGRPLPTPNWKQSVPPLPRSLSSATLRVMLPRQPPPLFMAALSLIPIPWSSTPMRIERGLGRRHRDASCMLWEPHLSDLSVLLLVALILPLIMLPVRRIWLFSPKPMDQGWSWIIGLPAAHLLTA